MPLRDHFRPPDSKRSSWESFHGLWPGIIVQKLAPLLPEGFVAEPRVHLGSWYEIDDCAFEPESGDLPIDLSSERTSGQTLQSVPAPTLTLDAEFPNQYSFEVLVFDLERDRRLVAAIEIVSSLNKDRPESRQLFVAKCFHLLRNDVCLSIIDLVTIRQFNLYSELLTMLGHSDPAFAAKPSPIYAVTCHKRELGRQTKLDTWSQPLAIGEPLASLPVWLSESLTVTLDLESSYEEACRVLKI